MFGNLNIWCLTANYTSKVLFRIIIYFIISYLSSLFYSLRLIAKENNAFSEQFTKKFAMFKQLFLLTMLFRIV